MTGAKKAPKVAKRSDKGPRDGEVSAAEMAKRLEMTPQALGLWCKRPGAPVRVEGNRVWVQAAAFLRWRERELVAQALKDVQPAVSLDEARTRKALAEAQLVELEVAKALASVILVEDSAKVVGAILDRLVALLRSLAVRLAHLGEHVEQAAEAEVELIIAELSEFDEDVLPEPEAEAA
jgi:hypothetical protein